MAGLLKAARWRVGRGRRRVQAMRSARTIEERLVWVFGSPRSGSTWLLRVLGDHDSVVPVNEPMLGWYLGPFLSDLPGFGSADLDSHNFTLRQVQEAKPSQFFAGEFEHAWRPALARMMCDRFAAHVERYPPGNGAGRALVLIKEPNGSQSADIIMSALPRARFLFLLRDGRDVVDSDLAAHMPGAWVTKEFPGAQGLADNADRLPFVVQSARKWLWRTEVTQRAYDAHPGPKLTMRYEDLLADPRRHMRALLDWLGLDMSDSELQATLDRHAFENVPAERRGSLEFFRAASPGLWRQNLTEEEQAAMEAVIGPKLKETGYGPP